MAELVYPPVITFARGVFRYLGLRFTITGGEHVPRTGGAVMAINHIGYLDFTFAGFAARPAKRLVRFMAKQEVFDHKVSGPLMRGMHHIPVDRAGRAADSYHAAVEALRRGEVVGVFPEATISRSFELKGFKTGAVRMAQEADVPIVPCVIWGSQRVWTKGRSKDLKRRRRPIRIALGEPFRVEGQDPTEATAELKRRMQVLLEEARATYPEAPSGADDAWWLPLSMGGTAPSLEDADAMDAADVAARAARRAERDRS